VKEPIKKEAFARSKELKELRAQRQQAEDIREELSKEEIFSHGIATR
jgi:hypothetical protein